MYCNQKNIGPVGPQKKFKKENHCNQKQEISCWKCENKFKIRPDSHEKMAMIHPGETYQKVLTQRQYVI